MKIRIVNTVVVKGLPTNTLRNEVLLADEQCLAQSILNRLKPGSRFVVAFKVEIRIGTIARGFNGSASKWAVGGLVPGSRFLTPVTRVSLTIANRHGIIGESARTMV